MQHTPDLRLPQTLAPLSSLHLLSTLESNKGVLRRAVTGADSISGESLWGLCGGWERGSAWTEDALLQVGNKKSKHSIGFWP